jgi:hypothetical protein
VRSTLILAAIVLTLTACGDSNTTPTTTPQSGTPTSSPATPERTTTPTLPGPAEQLLYGRADNSIWLFDTATGENEQLVAAGVCKSAWSSAVWTDDGSKFAVSCTPGPAVPGATAYVFSSDGQQIDSLDGYVSAWSADGNALLLFQLSSEGQYDTLAVRTYALDGRVNETTAFPNVLSWTSFAPGGSRFAYFRKDDAACAPGCPIGISVRDVADGSEQTFGDLFPHIWIDGATLVVQEGYVPRTESVGEAPSLLNVDAGEREPAPALTCASQCWLAEDPTKVIVLTFGEGTPGIGVGIVDIATQTLISIEGSSISYPSDHIPTGHVTSTGDQIYWFDATGGPSRWYRANYDGTGLEQLGEADSYFLTFSPSVAHVAYLTASPNNDENHVVVATIDARTTVDLPPSTLPLAWRPTTD